VRLFKERTGEAYPADRLKEIFKEGEGRYKELTPPGYKDEKSKSEPHRKYGDLVLWYQLIDKATEAQKPVILVSDDVKEDWWWEAKGMTLGPRPELVAEMRNRASVAFYMYQPSRFMEQAGKLLDEKVDQSAIDEAKAVEKAKTYSYDLVTGEIEIVDEREVLKELSDIMSKSVEASSSEWPESKQRLLAVMKLKKIVSDAQRHWREQMELNDWNVARGVLNGTRKALLELMETSSVPGQDRLMEICREIVQLTQEEWVGRSGLDTLLLAGARIILDLGSFVQSIKFIWPM
jgi:hypothetical protein